MSLSLSFLANCKTFNVFYCCQANAVVAKQIYMTSELCHWYQRILLSLQLKSEFTQLHLLKFVCKSDHFSRRNHRNKSGHFCWNTVHFAYSCRITELCDCWTLLANCDWCNSDCWSCACAHMWSVNIHSVLSQCAAGTRMLLYWNVKTVCVVKAKQKHDVLKQNYDDMKTQLQQVQYIFVSR